MKPLLSPGSALASARRVQAAETALQIQAALAHGQPGLAVEIAARSPVFRDLVQPCDATKPSVTIGGSAARRSPRTADRD